MFMSQLRVLGMTEAPPTIPEPIRALDLYDMGQRHDIEDYSQGELQQKEEGHCLPLPWVPCRLSGEPELRSREHFMARHTDTSGAGRKAGPKADPKASPSGATHGDRQ